jgi:hypothetical protein
MTIPDRWVIVKLTPKDGDSIYRVLASFYGGYLGGDSWKMNSGIVGIEEDEEYFYFKGFSGSSYKCHKAEHLYGMSGLASGVLSRMESRSSDVGSIELMPQETDWINLIK